MLYPYEKICQALGGFSCPLKGKQFNMARIKKIIDAVFFYSWQISVKILHLLLHLHEKLNADWAYESTSRSPVGSLEDMMN